MIAGRRQITSVPTSISYVVPQHRRGIAPPGVPRVPVLDWEEDMGSTHFVRFDSTQSQKVFIPTQLMIHNGLQGLIQINSRLEMFFWNLIQIDSRLK